MSKFMYYLMVLFLSFNSYSAIRLNGAGATFPYPLYSKWFSEYQKIQDKVVFNYQPIGSGGGIRQVFAQTVDFGASDVPLSKEEKNNVSFNILQIPMTIGAIVIVYHLEGLNEGLKLDSKVLSKIFLGEIKKWNDPLIQKLNQGIKLPNKDILVVRRADASGTTAVFTGYLSNADKTFQEKVGSGKSVKWGGVGAKGNDGITAMVKQMDGSIGYVELAYATNSGLKFFKLKNKFGKFVSPTTENITDSANNFVNEIKDESELVGDILNEDGASVYPITSFTYIILPLDNKDIAKKQYLKEFIIWAISEGQKFAPSLHYAQLPAKLQSEIIKRIKKI